MLDPRRMIDPPDLAGSPDAARGFVAEAEHATASRASSCSDSIPSSWASFAQAMETLTALRGPDLLRVKGFLDVDRAAAVRCWCSSSSTSPIRRSSWRTGPSADRTSRLVFITRNLPEQPVRDLFRAVWALTPTSSNAGSSRR